MKFQIIGRPEFFFNLSKEQIDVLMKLSSTHYDAICKSASRPGINGFLLGWRNTIVYGENKIRLRATWRQFDILIKICEMGRSLDYKEGKIVETVRVNVLSVMHEFNKNISPAWDYSINYSTEKAQ